MLQVLQLPYAHHVAHQLSIVLTVSLRRVKLDTDAEEAGGDAPLQWSAVDQVCQQILGLRALPAHLSI